MLPAISSQALYAPLRSLPEQIGRLASSRLSDADKAKLAEGAKIADALSQSVKTARDEARNNVKTRAKETIQRLKDEYKLIKKMWAHDPKQMAKQLARIAKDLKSAVADYAEAAQANGERAQGAREVLEATSPPVKDTVARDAAIDGPSQASAAASETAPDVKVESVPVLDAETAKAVSAYQRTIREAAVTELDSAGGEAHGDLEFVREVRGFAKEIRKTLQEAKIRAALAPPNKERTEAFKDADKALKEIDEAVEDMKKDVKADFPEIASGIPSTGAGVMA